MLRSTFDELRLAEEALAAEAEELAEELLRTAELLEEELRVVVPLLRLVLPLWLPEELFLTLLELPEALEEPEFRLELALLLPLLRLVLPLWLLRAEEEEALPDCFELREEEERVPCEAEEEEEVVLRLALLLELLPEERVDEEEEVVERLLLPELRVCAEAEYPRLSIRAIASAETDESERIRFMIEAFWLVTGKCGTVRRAP